MMSALKGGGSWKSGRSKGGCVNFILQISSKCGQGGEGVKKSDNFADVISGCPQRVFGAAAATSIALLRPMTAHSRQKSGSHAIVYP